MCLSSEDVSSSKQEYILAETCWTSSVTVRSLRGVGVLRVTDLLLDLLLEN